MAKVTLRLSSLPELSWIMYAELLPDASGLCSSNL